MSQYSRFVDLREPLDVWDLPLEYVESLITTPSGEELHSATLASPCADFLVVDDTCLWGGVTVAILPKDIGSEISV